MVDFSKKLTLDSIGAQQHWHLVEYPEVGGTNTTKHPGKTFLIIKKVTLYGQLLYQTNKYKVAFLTGAMPMTEWTPKGWFCYGMMLENAAVINQLLLFPYYCQRHDLSKKWGFIVLIC